MKYKLPALAWAVVILWLSLASGTGLPKVSLPYLDKAVHFAFYFVLVVLLYYGWRSRSEGQGLQAALLAMILLLAVLYGVSIELLQERFTTNRHFEWMDVVANSVGGVIGTLISVKLFK